ncbi:MAG: hypothetical protein M1282_00980 [Chloroflexi bacterium]|nr:hypothetical protein [Chloroflexota bacterium]
MFNVEKIRNQTSLKALAEEAGAEFMDNHHLSSHCPLPRHAGDRSSLAFTIYDHEQSWKCHSSCPSDANGGDVISFYMAWKNVDFITACTELSERTANPLAFLPKQDLITDISADFPSELFPPSGKWQRRAEYFIQCWEQNLSNDIGKGAREYLEKERGLTRKTWRAFRLGYNPFNMYDHPSQWDLDGKKIWLPRGIVIPGFYQKKPWYIKVRRPLPGHSLEKYIGAWTEKDGLKNIKFGGPRAGHSTLFRLEVLDYSPVLILTEGEWDAMLIWEYCSDICDVGTIGGASAKFDALDLALLTRYQAILVVYDKDKAGEEGSKYIASLQGKLKRFSLVDAPAHDLTDYWKSGGDLRVWAYGYISKALDDAHNKVGGN